MKIIIGLAFLAIVAALAAAGYFMLQRPTDRDNPQAKRDRMAKALAVRVGVSIALFLTILLSYQMGWIHPTGLPLGR
ncbi:MAG: twin transmembrane helix small protein [Leptothrix sp. (in: b-proteobacteria)]|jgi:purine-cytosine permease-like protein